MVSIMSDARLSRATARRPGAGVPIDPGKLAWVRNARLLKRDQLSDRIAEVARERDIRDEHDELVTYGRDAIAKLENGERKPTMPTFTAIVAALDCDPADLLIDFPGTRRAADMPDLPSDDEVCEILKDCTDPVSVLKERLSTRAWNSISNRWHPAPGATIGDLVEADVQGDLADTPNLGFVQINEIREVLAGYALEKQPRTADDPVAEAV